MSFIPKAELWNSAVKNFEEIIPIRIKGRNYVTFSGLSSDKWTYYYQDMKIQMNDEVHLSNLPFTENLSLYNIGIIFIQRFDWVMDFRQKKVYFKSNQNLNKGQIPSAQHSTFVQDGKLKVRWVGEQFIEVYEPGDDII